MFYLPTYVLGPPYSAFWVSQWLGQGVFQPSQHVHYVVKRADHLRLLREVERKVSEIRRILLQSAARSGTAWSACPEPDCKPGHHGIVIIIFPVYVLRLMFGVNVLFSSVSHGPPVR